MALSKSIKSTRLDLYKAIVDNSDDYPFQHRYELFTLGAAIGFLREETYKKEKGNSYSQTFIKVGDITRDEHQSAIEFIYSLVKAELVQSGEVDEDIDEKKLETKAWTRMLEHADAGTDYVDKQVDIQGNFDLIGFVKEHEEKWPDRIEDALGGPPGDERILHPE
ncbi:hypothetical protein [Halocatena halophila]|uniref:hypothetical protein n=1 Tax=Halocatena halophila TaxID=2814576 RepID=UPI002ED68217